MHQGVEVVVEVVFSRGAVGFRVKSGALKRVMA